MGGAVTSKNWLSSPTSGEVTERLRESEGGCLRHAGAGKIGSYLSCVLMFLVFFLYERDFSHPFGRFSLRRGRYSFIFQLNRCLSAGSFKEI